MRRVIWLIAILLVLLGLVVGGWLLSRGTAPSPYVADAVVDSPYWSEHDRLIDIDGVTLRVRESGPENAQPVLLIHGFSYSLESWEAWAQTLDDTYRVIRFDLPGHGLSGPDPDNAYAVSDTVEVLDGLMTALDLNNTVLVGNSLGGLVAWRYTADNSDRVARLALLAPGGYSINGVTEEPVAVPVAVSFYLRSAPLPMVQGATARLFGDASRMPDGMSERVRDLMLPQADALIARLEQFTLPDPEADLARISRPVLLIWGERDVMVPVDHGERMLAVIPDAELIRFTDLGHIPHEEAPADTVDDLLVFMQE